MQIRSSESTHEKYVRAKQIIIISAFSVELLTSLANRRKQPGGVSVSPKPIQPKAAKAEAEKYSTLYLCRIAITHPIHCTRMSSWLIKSLPSVHKVNVYKYERLYHKWQHWYNNILCDYTM